MSITCSRPEGHFRISCLFCSMLSPYSMWGDNNYQDREQKWARANNKEEDLQVEKEFKKQSKTWGTRKGENHAKAAPLRFREETQRKGWDPLAYTVCFPQSSPWPRARKWRSSSQSPGRRAEVSDWSSSCWEPPQALVTWHLQTGHSSFSEPQKRRLSKPEGTAELIRLLTLT